MVSTCPFISKSFNSFTNSLEIVPIVSITIDIIVTFVFHSFSALLLLLLYLTGLCSLYKMIKYLSYLLIDSFNFYSIYLFYLFDRVEERRLASVSRMRTFVELWCNTRTALPKTSPLMKVWTVNVTTVQAHGLNTTDILLPGNTSRDVSNIHFVVSTIKSIILMHYLLFSWAK